MPEAGALSPVRSFRKVGAILNPQPIEKAAPVVISPTIGMVRPGATAAAAVPPVATHRVSMYAPSVTSCHVGASSSGPNGGTPSLAPAFAGTDAMLPRQGAVAYTFVVS